MTFWIIAITAMAVFLGALWLFDRRSSRRSGGGLSGHESGSRYRKGRADMASRSDLERPYGVDGQS